MICKFFLIHLFLPIHPLLGPQGPSVAIWLIFRFTPSRGWIRARSFNKNTKKLLLLFSRKSHYKIGLPHAYRHKSSEKNGKNNRHHYTYIQMPKSFLFTPFYGRAYYIATTFFSFYGTCINLGKSKSTAAESGDALRRSRGWGEVAGGWWLVDRFVKWGSRLGTHGF